MLPPDEVASDLHTQGPDWSLPFVLSLPTPNPVQGNIPEQKNRRPGFHGWKVKSGLWGQVAWDGVSTPLLTSCVALGESLLFSCLVVSDSLRPQGLQHARLLCPSPSSRVCQVHVHCISDAILSSVTLFSCCPQSFPASRSFPMSWLLGAGG